jgi:glycine/sarcosine/betaine reductase component B subunit
VLHWSEIAALQPGTTTRLLGEALEVNQDELCVLYLPRVAYVFQIQPHQRQTGVDEGIFYGDPVHRMLPTMVYPNEILDGALFTKIGRGAA